MPRQLRFAGEKLLRNRPFFSITFLPELFFFYFPPLLRWAHFSNIPSIPCGFFFSLEPRNDTKEHMKTFSHPSFGQSPPLSDVCRSSRIKMACPYWRTQFVPNIHLFHQETFFSTSFFPLSSFPISFFLISEPSALPWKPVSIDLPF